MYEYMRETTKNAGHKYCLDFFGNRISYSQFYRKIEDVKWGIIDVAQESGGRSFPPFWNTAGSRKSALSDSENRWCFPRMTAKQKLLPLCVIPWWPCAGRFGNAMDFSAGKNWIWMQSGRNCSILWRNIRPLTGHTKAPASIIRIPNRGMYGRAW